MANQPPSSGPKRRRRDRGDGTIAWDKANKCYVGKLSLGYNSDGKTRNRPSVRGKTKAEAKDNLDKLRDEINAGIRTPATYTIEQCVKDWLDSIERDPHTMETIAGQAKNWIYPKIGTTKLKDFTATDADKFFKELAEVARQAIARHDQEHASPLYPPRPGSQPYRPERSRADRPPGRPAGAPVPRNDPRASRDRYSRQQAARQRVTSGS